MAGIQLTGLATGLDTEALVSQLMASESVGRTRIVLQQARADARRDGLNDVRAKLTTARDAAAALGSAATWTPTQTASSSDEAKATARILSGAGPGGYQVAVTRLASAEQRTFAYTPQPGATTLDVNGVVVAIDANASVDGVAAAINGRDGIGVYAVNVGGSLVLASRSTGAASTITVAGSATLVEDVAKRRVGQDAELSVDGGPTITSATNTVSGALAGVELTLRSTGTTTITVSPPTVDRSGLQAKVKAFVDAYNAAQDAIRGQVTEKAVPNARTSTDARKGVLFGDSTLTQAATALRQTAASVLSGTGNGANLDELADLGISTGAATGGAANPSAVQGRLVLDTARLTAAIESDPAGVERLLKRASTVLTEAFDPLTRAGGRLAARLESAESARTALSGQLTRMDERLERKEEQYRRRFQALESAMSRLQGLQSQMGASLAQLQSGQGSR